MTEVAAELRQPGEFAAVGVEDGVPAGRQQGGEQPLLGRPVPGQVAMVVEMVPGQVGKGGGGDRNSIKPELCEAVARSLDRRVFDPLPGESRKVAMQGHRVRRRQRAGTPPGGADETERAEARGAAAERRPDLADEMDDRRLAVGAGDGDDHARRRSMKAGGQQCQAAMRVRVGNDRDARAAARREIERLGPVGQDRDGAALDRIGGEGPAVEPRPGQSGKQRTRPNVARIGGNADDLRISRQCCGTDQLSKLQYAYPGGSRASVRRRFRARLHRPAGRRAAARCAR